MSFHFAPFELDEQTRELRLRGDTVPLQPRVFDVLAYLIRHRDRMVGKEELLNTLWPDVLVTDASLQRAISLIRATLQRGGRADAIQTRARLGYRFVGSETAAAPARESADRPPLLEREPFLEELAARFHQARRGEGQAVLIAGEAGIGKSTLLAAFTAGTGADTPVLRGYCDALFTPRAFGAVLDLADQLSATGGGAVELEAGRERIFAQLLARLRAIPGGTIVVLEDLHWADEATLDFVRFLGRRIAGTRCLLLATYRDDEVGGGHLLHRTFGDLTGGHVSRLKLRPLSAGAVAALARDRGQDAGRLLELTGGNPFLVHELLSSPGAAVPATVRDSMLARLARCSAAARQVCEIVALLPGRAELGLVTRVLGDTAEAVDETVARGVIVHERDALSYRHELARRAVENVIAPARARALHARILAVLREQKADVARLVHHARCAGDQAAVLSLAPEAGRHAAAVGAHREAVAHFGTALVHAAQLPAATRADLLEQHAYECYLTGQIRDAVDSASAAMALRRELHEIAAQGRLQRFLSRQHWFLGDRAAAEHHAVEAVAMLEPLGASHDLGLAYSNRSQLAMLRGEREAAVAFGEKAVALARALDDAEVEAHALNNMGTVRLINAGEPDGRAQLERSLQLALAHNLHEHAARAYVNLLSCAILRPDPSAARRHLAEGLAYCEERDLESWTIYLRAQQSRHDLERGDWDRAESTAAQLVRRAATPSVSRIPALTVLGLVRLRRGATDAGTWLDEAHRLAESTDEAQRMAPIAAARAEAAWLERKPAAIIAEVDRSLSDELAASYPWQAGELLFWKSRAVAARMSEAPAWLPAPYRLALGGDWRGAAAAFAEKEMPYLQALVLAGGDTRAAREARRLLEQLGARATLAALGLD